MGSHDGGNWKQIGGQMKCKCGQSIHCLECECCLDMQLSKHFKLGEFLSPNDPVRPGAQELANLTELCNTVLEPLRMQLGRPLVITSGFRSTSHNQKIGGAKGSMHCLGIAADISVPAEQGSHVQEQVKVARLLYQNPAVGGIGLYAKKQIVHVDIRDWVGKSPAMWIESMAGRMEKLPSHIVEAIRGKK